MGRIKILDSLRGLAALIVVFHHIYTRLHYLFKPLPELVNFVFGIISKLNVEAVLFFFMLSGFSIRLSLKNQVVFSKPLLNDYLYRRFRRILPLYILSLLFTLSIGFILSITSRSDYSLWNFIGNLFFLQISASYKGYWFSPYGENGPLWSLPFEMCYYLFFPAYSYFLYKIFGSQISTGSSMRRALLISFLVSSLCVFLNKWFFFPYIAYLTLFYTWFSGFFLAHICRNGQLKQKANLYWILSITGVLILAFAFFRADSVYKLSSGSVILCILFFCVLLQHRLEYLFRPVKHILNFLFYKIGKGSYALYLFHFPVVLCFKYNHQKSILLVVTIFVGLTIACIFLEEFLVKRKFLLLRIGYIR